MAEFLSSLSARSRTRWNLESYDIAMAREHCAAIGRYDKLRMIAVTNVNGSRKIVALMELSFSIPPSDQARFRSYGISLDETFDCRFAPCVRDEFQRTGIASELFSFIVDIARRFGKRRILLWGGVFADNIPAISFYRKQGFIEVGECTSQSSTNSFDFILTLPGAFEDEQ
ncbi:MAG: GNAT family N-acetyltransferase [Corynebacteriales bacterium]|nr:GNAT family N-acetyltransferase [Mycobacteriales bacterium]